MQRKDTNPNMPPNYRRQPNTNNNVPAGIDNDGNSSNIYNPNINQMNFYSQPTPWNQQIPFNPMYMNYGSYNMPSFNQPPNHYAYNSNVAAFAPNYNTYPQQAYVSSLGNQLGSLEGRQ